MSEQKHTPEPWTLESGINHIKVWGERQKTGAVLIAEVRNESPKSSTFGMEQIANADRIVACVNACAGISTEALENGAIKAIIAAFEKTQIALVQILNDPENPANGNLAADHFKVNQMLLFKCKRRQHAHSANRQEYAPDRD